jgi:hypothetical protein
VEKWLYYASMMKFAFVDSYNEGSKGERMGKLNQSTQNRSIDLETGNTIQHNISLLDYIERKIHDVSGVSQQRLGSIYASEGVGNVQKSVTQSAIITEKLFQVHNWTKQRVLTQLLEVAKVAYSENNKKLQYITDDLGTIFFEYDGFDMSNEECGVFVSDSIKDQMTMEFVKQWAHAALQNDKTEFSSIIDIASTNSLGDIKAKLKETGAELAGEMSGHVFFKNRFFGYDDALYAGLRFIEALSKDSETLDSFLSKLPKVYNTPELRSDCPDDIKFSIVEKFVSKAKTAFGTENVLDIDGARVKFPGMGWGLIRASNTQPVIVMRFEGNTPDSLKTIKAKISSVLSEISTAVKVPD